MRWREEVLPQGWSDAADALVRCGALEHFYLAGGTGLALQCGHRRSVDLDLFSQAAFSAPDRAAMLRGLDGLRDVEVSSGTLHLVLGGVKVSFLHYAYPILFPLQLFEKIRVADPRDIACMKVAAIANRGSRRDFIDLYFAAMQYSLGEILGWFEQKYAATPHSRVHLLKALTYFADAEPEPMPHMLVSLDWPTVTSYFLDTAPRLI